LFNCCSLPYWRINVTIIIFYQHLLNYLDRLSVESCCSFCSLILMKAGVILVKVDQLLMLLTPAGMLSCNIDTLGVRCILFFCRFKNLQMYGIHVFLLQWVGSSLSNRQERVRTNQPLSYWLSLLFVERRTPMEPAYRRLLVIPMT